MKRHSITIWNNNIQSENKNLKSQTKPLNKEKYSYNGKFDENMSTNPGELMAAAHAGSFSMRLIADLIEAGFEPQMLETKCDILIIKGVITKSELIVKAKVGGINEEDFDRITKNTIQNCPISKALNVKIELKATLEKNPELINRLLINVVTE